MSKLRHRAAGPLIWVPGGQKGGTGKSTLALCLAYHAFEQGNRVLLIDGDGQGTLSTAATRIREVQSRAGFLPGQVPATGPALLMLAATDTALTLGWVEPGPDAEEPVSAYAALPEMVARFQPDLVLLDPPGRLDDMHRSVLSAADVAFLVTAQGVPDRDALLQSADLLREVQQHKPQLVARVLLNKWRPRTQAAGKAEQAVQETGLALLKSRIANRTGFEVAFEKGRPPRREAQGDIAALYTELRGLS